MTETELRGRAEPLHAPCSKSVGSWYPPITTRILGATRSVNEVGQLLDDCTGICDPEKFIFWYDP